jgi:hypothetical protein
VLWAESDDARRVHASAQRLSEEILIPFLERWRPRLAEHEALRPPGRTLVDHEARWEKASAFRSDLRRLSPVLRQINQELADVTGADLESPIAVRKPDR